MPFPLQRRFSFHRPITSYARVQKWLGNVIRNRQYQLRRLSGQSPKYLNIGCGRNTSADFINVDYLWHPGVHLCWDITRGLPFPDASVQGIFTEHCLEHFSLSVAEHLLREFCRVLVPGGTVRIVVPDGELYLGTYWARIRGDTSREFPFQALESFNGLYSPILSVNRVFYQDRDSPFGHRFMYDEAALCLLLQHAGFDWAKRVDYCRGADSRLLIDTESRQCESLYVEAGTVSAPLV